MLKPYLFERNMVHYKNIFPDKESVSQDEET